MRVTLIRSATLVLEPRGRWISRRSQRALRALGAGFVAATLMVAAPASAHGPTHAPGYSSTVIEIRPAVLGLSATVLGGGELLSLRNWSNRTVVVLGPDGRPMLRFADNRVYRRVADGWRLLKRGTGHAWHDSRIHWNGATPPAAVVDAPERDHSIAPWRIPALVDGRRVVIRGVIGWAAQPISGEERGDDLPGWVVPGVVACSAAVLAVLASLFVAPTLRRWGRD